jgi:chromosome segregation ATPase
MLFKEVEEHKLKKYHKQTNEYFESAPEFQRLKDLTSKYSSCANQNWGDTLIDLQESENEASRENQKLRKEILDASTVSHEYRMRIKVAKANVSRISSSSNVERRQLEGQIAESQAARRSLDKSIPEIDAQVQAKRANLTRLERELQRLRAALRAGD